MAHDNIVYYHMGNGIMDDYMAHGNMMYRHIVHDNIVENECMVEPSYSMTKMIKTPLLIFQVIKTIEIFFKK